MNPFLQKLRDWKCSPRFQYEIAANAVKKKKKNINESYQLHASQEQKWAKYNIMKKKKTKRITCYSNWETLFVYDKFFFKQN